MSSGERLVAGGVLALGMAFSIGTYFIPEAAGYAQVGPRVFPGIVAAGLLACGLLLVVQAWRGGFRARELEDTDPFDWRAFAWIGAGLLAHLALIGVLGFIAASILLFMMVARALGSQKRRRDLVIAIILSVALYVLFTRVLGLALGPKVLGF